MYYTYPTEMADRILDANGPDNANDFRLSKIERRLSQLGALVSLAVEDVQNTKRSALAAELKLQQLQAEIEQLYITMTETFSIAPND